MLGMNNNNLTLITNDFILNLLDMKHTIKSDKRIRIPVKRMIMFDTHKCDLCKRKGKEPCNQYYLNTFTGCSICKECYPTHRKTKVLYTLSLSHHIIPWKHFIPIFNTVTKIDFENNFLVKRTHGGIESWKANQYDDSPWFDKDTIYIPMKSYIDEVGKSIHLADFLYLNKISQPEKILYVFQCVYL